MVRHLRWTAAFILAAALCAVMYSAAYAETTSGTCGTNLTWSLNNGTLTISGTGDMTDYSDSISIPWNSCNTSITKAVISSGVTSIGNHAWMIFSGTGKPTPEQFLNP